MFKAIGNFFKNFLTREEVLPEQIGVIQTSVDTDRLIKILKVKETAKEDGENEKPDTAETHIDSFQLKVYQFIATDISQRKQQINENILSLDKAISTADIRDKFEEAKNIRTLTDHEIESIVQEEKNHLGDFHDKSEKLEKDFNAFKVTHKIKHVPDYPDSYRLYIAILLYILLGETILNGIYFAQGSEFGLLGGIIIALGIALVNLAIAFCLGRASAYKNHIKYRLKILGYLSIVGVFAWLSAYNLMIAHYRQQLDVDINKAGTLAVKLLFQSPLALDKFEYWILFLLGLVFGLIAYADGCLWDDSYPGYGKLYRRGEESKVQWHDEQVETIVKVDNLKKGKLGELKKCQDEVNSTFNYLKEIVGQKTALIENLENTIEQIESSGKILIKMYREENMVYRQTDPPKYFMEDVAPPEHAILETNIENDHARIKEQKELVDEFVRMAEQIKNSIIDSYNQAIKTIANIHRSK